MPESISRLLQKVKDFWNDLEKPQKTRLYITSIIVLVSMIAGIIFLTKPNHIVLFRNVPEEDIKVMVDTLNGAGIWNKIGDDGTSILVNFKDQGRAKVELGGKQYSKSDLTFADAIAQIGISTTESDKKQIWSQQKKSEIENMLELADNVEFAEISLAVPETPFFLVGNPGEQPKPTAHVIIKPKYGRFTQEQVRAIQLAVARSVENLDPENITVVDNNLNLLNTEAEDDSIGIATSREKLRLEKENNLQKKVYEYFGVGQFDNFDTLRVVANVILDFNTEKTQTKTYATPQGMDGGAVISDKHVKEEATNSATGAAPGTDTNPGETGTPSYQMGNGENDHYKMTSDEGNYVYDEKITESEKSTGGIIKEESSLAISLWYGRKVLDDSGITDEFIDQVKLAASTATGIPVSNVSVNKLKMSQPDPVTIETKDIIREMINDYGFFALMLVLVIGLVIAALPRRKKAEEEEEEEEAELQPAMASGPRFVIPEYHGEPLPEIDLEERSEVKKQLEKFVKQKPDAVAQLLRNWLSDDWDS